MSIAGNANQAKWGKRCSCGRRPRSLLWVVLADLMYYGRRPWRLWTLQLRPRLRLWWRARKEP